MKIQLTLLAAILNTLVICQAAPVSGGETAKVADSGDTITGFVGSLTGIVGGLTGSLSGVLGGLTGSLGGIVGRVTGLTQEARALDNNIEARQDLPGLSATVEACIKELPVGLGDFIQNLQACLDNA